MKLSQILESEGVATGEWILAGSATSRGETHPFPSVLEIR